jgi:uncharacterized protein (DUF1330 family)
MAAYVIAHFDQIDDQDVLDRYRELAGASVKAFGGRYLVRGDSPKTAVEGAWSPRFLVILEFADLATAHAWYRSEAYAPALAIRGTAGPRSLTIVDGAPAA